MAGNTIVYVGAEASGLYRKQAGDAHWDMLTDGLAPATQARAIAIHPNDPAPSSAAPSAASTAAPTAATTGSA